MSRALRTVAQYAQHRTKFDNNAPYREMLGPHFNGVNSPWDDLREVLLWYEQVFVALPEHQVQAEPFRKLVFTARVERLRAIKVQPRDGARTLRRTGPDCRTHRGVHTSGSESAIDDGARII